MPRSISSWTAANNVLEVLAAEIVLDWRSRRSWPLPVEPRGFGRRTAKPLAARICPQSCQVPWNQLPQAIDGPPWTLTTSGRRCVGIGARWSQEPAVDLHSVFLPDDLFHARQIDASSCGFRSVSCRIVAIGGYGEDVRWSLRGRREQGVRCPVIAATDWSWNPRAGRCCHSGKPLPVVVVGEPVDNVR